MRQGGVVHRLPTRILTAPDRGEAVAVRQDE